jgi:hypothetical protein
MTYVSAALQLKSMFRHMVILPRSTVSTNIQ